MYSKVLLSWNRCYFRKEPEEDLRTYSNLCCHIQAYALHFVFASTARKAFSGQIIRLVHTQSVNPSRRIGRASKPPHGYSDTFLERTTESSQVRKKNGRLSAQTPLVLRKSPQLFLRYGTQLKCEALLVRKN